MYNNIYRLSRDRLRRARQRCASNRCVCVCICVSVCLNVKEEIRNRTRPSVVNSLIGNCELARQKTISIYMHTGTTSSFLSPSTAASVASLRQRQRRGFAPLRFARHAANDSVVIQALSVFYSDATCENGVLHTITTCSCILYSARSSTTIAYLTYCYWLH